MIDQTTTITNWKTEVQSVLKRFGHRNWIVVADAAYPQQSNPAIETMVIDATQLEAVAYVNALIEESDHVEATIFLDRELEFVPESKAMGVNNYRTELNKILEKQSWNTRLHEDIIKELDASAKLFNVLVLKTNMTIPYTSVFFQLGCGYWSDKSEEELRSAM